MLLIEPKNRAPWKVSLDAPNFFGGPSSHSKLVDRNYELEIAVKITGKATPLNIAGGEHSISATVEVYDVDTRARLDSISLVSDPETNHTTWIVTADDSERAMIAAITANQEGMAV